MTLNDPGFCGQQKNPAKASAASAKTDGSKTAAVKEGPAKRPEANGE